MTSQQYEELQTHTQPGRVSGALRRGQAAKPKGSHTVPLHLHKSLEQIQSQKAWPGTKVGRGRREPHEGFLW